ncbi:microtubule cross-linking factor 1-like [Lynx rufus]|uniref:microtubule cross-linking factor 1-like n=1 Tax=Lynx rufus TaxID=61384 RepID=UPI001F128389|nr:microtubule cross-linking factor 1-like [Lynx rufus]
MDLSHLYYRRDGHPHRDMEPERGLTGSPSYTDGGRHAQERAQCAHPRGHTGASGPRTTALSHAPVSSLGLRRALLFRGLPGLAGAGKPGGHLKPDAGGGGGGLTSGRSWARGSEVTDEPGSSTRFPPLPAPPRPTASLPRAAVAPFPALRGLPSVAPVLLRLSALFPLWSLPISALLSLASLLPSGAPDARLSPRLSDLSPRRPAPRTPAPPLEAPGTEKMRTRARLWAWPRALAVGRAVCQEL